MFEDHLVGVAPTFVFRVIFEPVHLCVDEEWSGAYVAAGCYELERQMAGTYWELGSSCT